MALWPVERETPVTPYNGLLQDVCFRKRRTLHRSRLRDPLRKLMVKYKYKNIYAGKMTSEKCKQLVTRTKLSQREPN